jgi:hypothetical protein
VILNLLGALMLIGALVLAFVVGGIVDAVWPNEARGVAAGGGVFFVSVVVADLVYRWRQNRDRGGRRFILPTTGGQIFFVPVWVILGVLPAIGIAVLIAVNPPKKDPPRRADAEEAIHRLHRGHRFETQDRRPRNPAISPTLFPAL